MNKTLQINSNLWENSSMFIYFFIFLTRSEMVISIYCNYISIIHHHIYISVLKYTVVSILK